jgi:hypothetical protein
MINWIKNWLCDHKGWALMFIRNVHGDEINLMNGKRSVWECSHCHRLVYKDYLGPEEK